MLSKNKKKTTRNIYSNFSGKKNRFGLSKSRSKALARSIRNQYYK